jgi:nicotinamide riboside transporter PnuC
MTNTPENQESTEASNLLFYCLVAHLFFCVTGMNSAIFSPGEVAFDILYGGVVYGYFGWLKNLDPQQKKRAIKNFNENLKSYMETARWVSCVVGLALFLYFLYCGCSTWDSAWVSLLCAIFACLSAILPVWVADKIINRLSLSHARPRMSAQFIPTDIFPTLVLPVPLSPPRTHLAT